MKNRFESNVALLKRRGWKRLKKSDPRTYNIDEACWEEPFTGKVLTQTGAAYREVHRYNCPHTKEQEELLAKAK